MGQTLSPIFRVQVNSNQLPSWVPPVGTRVNIPGAGAVMNVSGANSGNFTTTGMTMAPLLGGPMGSILFHGGGHHDTRDNSVYAFDIATAIWSRFKQPFLGPFFLDAGNSVGGPQGGHWADGTFTAEIESQPFSYHNYNHGIVLPPGVGGAGPLGALYTNCRSFGPDAGFSSIWSHILDLTPPLVWKHFTTGPPSKSVFPTGGVMHDTLRGRGWFGNGNASGFYQISYIDFATKTYTSPAWKDGTPANFYAPFQGTMAYIQALDLLFYLRVYFDTTTGALTYKFQLIDPANITGGGVYQPGFTGTAPVITSEGGGDWDEVNQRCIYYEGQGGSTVFFLTAPSTVKATCLTTPWIWSSKTYTGPTPVATAVGINPHIKRFNWHPPTGCAFWTAATNSPTQAWRL